MLNIKPHEDKLCGCSELSVYEAANQRGSPWNQLKSNESST
jgi:hypothetical protein